MTFPQFQALYIGPLYAIVVTHPNAELAYQIVGVLPLVWYCRALDREVEYPYPRLSLTLSLALVGLGGPLVPVVREGILLIKALFSEKLDNLTLKSH